MPQAQEPYIADLVRQLNAVAGRKKLQKIVFLLQSVGAPLTARFEYHFYGPFSEQLADEVRWLVQTGQLIEEPRQTPGGHREYVYRAGEAAPSAEAFPAPYVTVGRHLNRLDARCLELMATMQYLRARGMTADEAGVRACELKSNQGYTSMDVTRAWAVLDQIQEASRTAARIEP